MPKKFAFPGSLSHRSVWSFRLLVLALVGSAAGCGGGGGSGNETRAGPTNNANIVVTADSPQVRIQGQFQRVDGYLSRSAKVLRSSGTGSSKAIFSPSISGQGFYRVYVWWPSAAGQGAGEVQVIVHHKGGAARLTFNQQVLGGQWNSAGIYELIPGASAEVEIADQRGTPAFVDAVRFEYLGNKAPALAIETNALPLASKDAAYAAQVEAIGVTGGPYTWILSAGELPLGLTLNPASGLISGTPAFAGQQDFSVRVFDARGESAQKRLTIEVLESLPSPGGEQQMDFGAGHRHALDGQPSGTPPNLSGLISLIAALPEGEWTRVNANFFSDVWTPESLRPLYGLGNPSPSAILNHWSSFAWDPNRGDLILYGGGHNAYTGNDVYRWHGTTRLWERASLPSEIKQDDLGNWRAVDGPDAAPASAHTYDNNIFLPIIDRFVVFGGAAFNNGGAYMRQVTATTSRKTGPYFFDPSRADGNKVGGTAGSNVQRNGPNPIAGGNMWQNRDMYVNVPGNPLFPATHVQGCTAYAQENGKDVVYIGAYGPYGGTDFSLYRYAVNSLADATQDTFQKVGTFWNGPIGRTACGYDPIQKVFLRIGAAFTYWDLNTAGPNNREVNINPTDPTGEFPALWANGNGSLNIQTCGFDFDPVRRQYALWCGDGRVWMVKPPATVSPNGWSITKQRAPLMAVPNGDVATGILGKWKYISNLDAFMGLQDVNRGNIWVYKPVGWLNPQGSVNLPPTVSIINPPEGATLASGNPIVITANASDPDGSVTKVEFYSGSTKIGEDLTSPYAFTWTNAPQGNQVLSAVATDNHGAQTVSGQVHIAVLPGATGTVVLQDGLNGYVLTRDTYLASYAGLQTLSFGGGAYLLDYLQNYTDLIRFGIFQSEGGPVPNGATIQSANLALYKDYYDVTYALNRMLVNWSESQATWLQRDAGLAWSTAGANAAGADYAAIADAQTAASWNPGWVVFDVTGAVQQMSGGQPNFGWRINEISGTAALKHFLAREYAADPTLRPKLTVMYSVP
jgi:hypothetical protein